MTTNREQLKRNGWKWIVAGYYNDTVKPPKKSGELALEAVHKSDSGKDLEISVFNERNDIGNVTVVEL